MNKSYLQSLYDFHLGPGAHPSGSSQEVHAGDDAGESIDELNDELQELEKDYDKDFRTPKIRKTITVKKSTDKPGVYSVSSSKTMQTAEILNLPGKPGKFYAKLTGQTTTSSQSGLSFPHAVSWADNALKGYER